MVGWSSYNEALKRRGDLTLWFSSDVIEKWYEADRVYAGDGAPTLYSDMAIYTCHELRLVFKLPLRQTEDFINSLFKLLRLDLHCPSYSILSKRLKQLNIAVPYYKQGHHYSNSIKEIAIDSTGLKCFGQDE